MSQEKSINLYAAAERIKQAVNKEQEIENILNELDEKLSLTKSEKIQVIEWLEKYFREDEIKRFAEKISRRQETYSKCDNHEFLLTSNTEILAALGKTKHRYGV